MKSTPLEQRVLQGIRESRMLRPGDRVGVAVSGGADSVGLLNILARLKTRLGIALLVLHFDHCLRGSESDADAAFVACLARDLSLEFMLDREDVAAAAIRNKWNLEDAARRLRYAFFQRVVDQQTATRVAVAHTADDQAETVLAHILRGTGPAGLAGIYPSVGSIVRPLLGVRRQDLRTFLAGIGQPWREDSSNLDVRQQRSRIRQHLLPVLKRDFSPQIVSRLSDLARLSREQESFWAALLEERFRSLVSGQGGEFSISVSDLLAPLSLPLDDHLSGDADATGYVLSTPTRLLTERLIRRLYQKVRGNLRNLSLRHVDQVIHLAGDSATGHYVELPGGVRVERSFGRLTFFAPGDANLLKASGKTKVTIGRRSAFQYSVVLPDRGTATVSVPELGTCFRLKVVDWHGLQRDTKSLRLPLDAELLRENLVLRNWRPGDTYRPSGRRQSHKLKELFLAARVPRRDRPSWPLLASQGRVVWVRGLPPAEEFCAGPSTKAGLIVEEFQVEGSVRVGSSDR